MNTQPSYYYINAYGHWLVTKNIPKGELVIRCEFVEGQKKVNKTIVKF